MSPTKQTYILVKRTYAYKIYLKTFDPAERMVPTPFGLSQGLYRAFTYVCMALFILFAFIITVFLKINYMQQKGHPIFTVFLLVFGLELFLYNIAVWSDKGMRKEIIREHYAAMSPERQVDMMVSLAKDTDYEREKVERYTCRKRIRRDDY